MPSAPEDGRVFFMHIMKTAGTTLARQFELVFDPHDVYPSAPRGQGYAAQYWQIGSLKDVPEEQMERLKLVHGHFPLIVADLIRPQHTITLLRHPVERVVSHLRHHRRHRPEMREKPFEEIYEDPWLQPCYFTNYQVKQFAFRWEDDPKGHLDVIPIDEDRYRLALANLDRVDMVGFTDRYDEFIGLLDRRFGWSLPEVKPMQVAPYRATVPDSLLARIEADNSADIEFYEAARRRYP